MSAASEKAKKNFKKATDIAKKIWNDPKRPKSIKTYADAIKLAWTKMK